MTRRWPNPLEENPESVLGLVWSHNRVLVVWWALDSRGDVVTFDGVTRMARSTAETHAKQIMPTKGGCRHYFISTELKNVSVKGSVCQVGSCVCGCALMVLIWPSKELDFFVNYNAFNALYG